MSLSIIALLFMRPLTPSQEPILHFRATVNPHCAVGVDCDDAISFVHVDSVLRLHKFRLLQTFLCHGGLAILIGASEKSVKTVLEREAPRNVFTYALDGDHGIPKVNRHWIQIPLKAVDSQEVLAKVPARVALWLGQMRRSDPNFLTAEYVTIRYLKGHEMVTGYRLREHFSKQRGDNQIIERDMPASSKQPYDFESTMMSR